MSLTMCLSSGRASPIFKTRLTIVSFFIKPKFQFIRLNSFQQNYVAATSISLSINKEAGKRCYSFKGSLLKDITKQDSLVKSCECNIFSEPKIPRLERSKFSAPSSSNLKTNVQIYSTSRSFSLQSRPPPSPKKSSSLAPQAPPTNEIEPQSSPSPSIDVKPNKAEKLQRAFTEYGPTIMALHLAISLISFGGFYALVSGGIDVDSLLKFLGVSTSAIVEKVPSGGTFVVALAIHKILAPIRISLTLGVTPILVRYMRTKGLMKAKTKTFN